MTEQPEAANARPSEADAGPPAAGALPPLNITGVVVTKAQLLDALRVYVPNVIDFNPLPDGEHFYILFSTDGQQPQTTA